MIVPSTRREPDRVRGAAEVAGDERQVAGLDGHVRAGADGDPEVGLGQRGASLTPSPTTATTLPLGLQAAHLGGLVGRVDLGEDALDPDLGGDGPRGFLAVAGEEHRREPGARGAPRPPPRSSA